ncbi:MAG: N-acetylmuramoyl-L-alanine amidase [candidate division KSB1 bacterium]|nr:N-acetylmuramoyl-L-alanine amidase [candidate division KSB1 bacterium]
MQSSLKSKHSCRNPFVFIWLLFLLASPYSAHAITYVETGTRDGDGIYTLLRRYELPTTQPYIESFCTLNKDRLDGDDTLVRGQFYQMPILVVRFDGQTIRSTLGIDDYDRAKELERYNKRMHLLGLRDELYTDDNRLWVPLHWFRDNPELKTPQDSDAEDTGESNPGKEYNFSIFGPKYSRVTVEDQRLKDCIFYLVSGHGGPDPGAIGKRGRYHLHEDEYAYDITLRLGRELIKHGALVYIIVRDPDDGIRDDAILKGDRDEYYWGNEAISRYTINRLEKRANILNALKHKNRFRSSNQYSIILHVDSRSGKKRVDIFYYYKQNDRIGKALALSMYRTVRDKYDEHQPGRGYKSLITTRNLYMLEHSQVNSVYIELGNIQNQRDQDRFVRANNRQAVANWLYLGVLDYIDP